MELRELLLIPLLSLMALQVKRCRDIGWSPWLVLISLIPLMVVIVLINVAAAQSLLLLMPMIQLIFMIILGIPKSRLTWQEYGFSGTAHALNSRRFRIIQCANCRTKIRVAFPPPAGVGKCPLCQQRFMLKADEYGSLTIYPQGDSGRGGSDLNEIASSEEAFRILGIDASLDQSQIRKAYKEKMSQYHPDKVSQLGIEIRELADRKSKQINKAYHYLRHID